MDSTAIQFTQFDCYYHWEEKNERKLQTLIS
jgi:hypothetical protein